MNVPKPAQPAAKAPDVLDINNEVLNLDVPSVEAPDIEHLEVKGFGLESLGLDKVGKKPQAAAKAKVLSRPPKGQWIDRARVHEYFKNLPWVLAMGGLGALVGGALVGTFMSLIASKGEITNLATIIARSDTGIMVGFVLAAGFSLVKRLELSPLSGLFICGFTSMVIGTLFHVFESAYVAPADNPLYASSAACFFGGAVTGIVLGYLIGEGNE